MAAALAVLVASAGGLLLPGLIVGRLLGARAPLETAFLLSQALLFTACLGLQVCGAPLAWWSVWLALLGLTAVCALAAARWSGVAGFRGPLLPPGPAWARAVLATFGLVLLLRCAAQPLSGFDTAFRWGGLAERVLERGTLDFYPPRRPEDFTSYFYVDGIAPLVSLQDWWLYAHAGASAPRWTCLLVVGQWLSAVSLVWRIGVQLDGPRTGALAALCLAWCPLFTRTVGIGQETGVMALAVVAALHALLGARPRDPCAAVLAGLAVGVAALAREYGWGFLPAALVVAWRRPARERLLVAGCALSLAAPWYVRNLILTGNPLYDLPLPLLPHNPVHAALLANAAPHYGWSGDPGARAGLALDELARYASLQVGLGLAGLLGWRRAAARWLLPFLLIGGAVWARSVAYTEGGLVYSLRVLAPCLALLSLPAAHLLAHLLSRQLTRALTVVLVLIAAGWAGLNTLLFPVRPGRIAWRETPRYLVDCAPLTGNPELRELPLALPRLLPPGARILTVSDAYAQVALRPLGYEVIPAWSPEVAFAFTPGADPQAVERGLRERGIVAFLAEPDQVHNRWLAGLPFFRELPRRRVLHRGTLTVLYDLR